VGLQCIAGYLWKRKLVTIGAIFIGCFFVSTVSENQVVSGLNTVAYFLAGFVLGIPIAWFFLSAGRIAFRIPVLLFLITQITNGTRKEPKENGKSVKRISVRKLVMMPVPIN